MFQVQEANQIYAEPYGSSQMNSRRQFAGVSAMKMRAMLPLLFFCAAACFCYASDKAEWGHYSGWDQERLTSKVIKLYVSDLPGQRRLAATLIGMLSPKVDSETASAIIAVLLKDSNSNVRLEALYACSGMRLVGLRPLLPLIRARTKDVDPDIRNAAVHVLSESEFRLRSVRKINSDMSSNL